MSDAAHDHHAHDHHARGHRHDVHHHAHPVGFIGFVRSILVPHRHDTADSVDQALEASAQGVRAVKISLGAIFGNTLAALGVVPDDGHEAWCLSDQNLSNGEGTFQSYGSAFPYVNAPY